MANKGFQIEDILPWGKTEHSTFPRWKQSRLQKKWYTPTNRWFKDTCGEGDKQD